MSSTSGSQNLLTNIFRPAYRYEIPTGGSTAVFVPTLDVSNIDVLATNSVTAFTAAIGDENENVYVGLNAGNAYSNLRGCSNVTAVGYAAASNVSNTTNSVYIGYASGANALDSSVNIAIGPNTKGNGISNIYIGSNTGSLGTGSNNILIGHNLTGSNLSNTLLIGPTPTIYGNLSTRRVGIGRDPSYNMDISGDSRITYRLGVGMEPGKAVDFNNNPLTNVPHTLDVSGYSFIRGALGINADPADYTFNLVGNMKFDDGAGRILMQKDPCGNSVFSFESYAAGKKAIFSIDGDICASSVVAPGSTFTGNVQACNVIATSDLSGANAYVTNIRGNRVFGQDVSGLRGRFDRVDITDISGSTGTVTTLTATTFSSTNFTTANIVLPGYLRDSLTPSTLDISGGNISNVGTTRSANFTTASSNSLNTIGGITLSNNNITYGGAISNTNAAANNNIGGVRLSNNTISNSGSTTSANFFGTAANSNNIGGITLSNSNISLGGTITGTTANTSNVIGGVTLSNGNITGTFQGAIATSNAVIGGYVRNTLTPSEFDISGGRIRMAVGAVSNPSYGFLTDPSSGLYMPSTSNVSIATAGVERMRVTSTGLVGIGRTAPSATLDVSGDVSANGFLASTYIRNAIIPTTFDISGGNISNSATTRSSNFLGTTGASNTIGGVILSNGLIRSDASDTFVVGLGESTSTIATSSNGITWTSRGATIFTVGRGVAWNGNLWVAVGNGGNTIATSTDGITWTGLGSIIFTGIAICIAWGRNTWVAGGSGTNTLAYSSDGSNWTGIGTSIFSSAGNCVAWNGSIWVAGGAGTNTLAYSFDGITWVGLGTSIFTTGVNGVAWNGRLWVAVGSGTNAFATSPDGINWTAQGGTGVFSTSGIAVAWNGSLWVAGGQGTNTLAYSSDGSNWTGVGATIFTTNGRCVTWNGYVWVAGGQGTNTYAYSFDGSNWTGAGQTGTTLLTRGVAARRYVLPVVDSIIADVSGGNIEFTGAIVGSNSAASNQIGGVVLRSSNVQIGDGAVNNPASAFVSDPSAGIYRPGANQFGVAIAGVQRLVLSNSNVGIGRVLPSATLDVSGDVSANGFLASTYIRNAIIPTTFDISGGRVRTAVGSVSNPAFGFLATDISAGMYLAASNRLGITVGGTARLLIDNSSIGVGIPGSTAKTALFEMGGGYDSAGTAIARSFPALAFNFGDGVNGGYRHFIRSRHNAAANNSGNAIDIFTNNTNTAEGSSGPGTNNLLVMSITSLGVGIGGISAPAAALDVSGILRMSNAGIVTNFTRDALTPSSYDISGGRVRTAVGSVGNPAFGFLATDISAGMYLAASNQLGIAVAGTARLLVDNSSIGIGQPSSATKTALFEIGGGYTNVGAQAGRSFPAMAFQYGDLTSGGYRHFIRTRHTTASNDNTNAIDFFTNNSNTVEGSSGPGTGNRLAMSITSGGVGIGMSNPIYELDISSATVSDGIRVTASNAQVNVRDQRTTGDLQLYQNNTDQGLYTVNSIPMIFSAGGTARMCISANGNVGIGTTNQGYRLDVVSDAATKAAINIDTWPRTTASICYCGTSSNSRSTDAVIFTTNTAISSNIITVASNIGTYFTVNRNGIYAFSVLGTGSTNNNYELQLDASTNIGHSNTANNIILSTVTGFNGAGRNGVNFTGYLPSNSGMYYKVKATSQFLSPTVRIVITFLQETTAQSGYFI